MIFPRWLSSEDDVDEVLMEYWAETMQDDVYAVCYDGYEAGREIAYEYVTKKKKEKRPDHRGQDR